MASFVENELQFRTTEIHGNDMKQNTTKSRPVTIKTGKKPLSVSLLSFVVVYHLDIAAQIWSSYLFGYHTSFAVSLILFVVCRVSAVYFSPNSRADLVPILSFKMQFITFLQCDYVELATLPNADQHIFRFHYFEIRTNSSNQKVTFKLLRFSFNYATNQIQPVT